MAQQASSVGPQANRARQARWRRRQRSAKAGAALVSQPVEPAQVAGLAWLETWLAENPIDWAQFDTDLSWLDSERFEWPDGSLINQPSASF